MKKFLQTILVSLCLCSVSYGQITFAMPTVNADKTITVDGEISDPDVTATYRIIDLATWTVVDSGPCNNIMFTTKVLPGGKSYGVLVNGKQANGMAGSIYSTMIYVP